MGRDWKPVQKKAHLPPTFFSMKSTELVRFWSCVVQARRLYTFRLLKLNAVIHSLIPNTWSCLRHRKLITSSEASLIAFSQSPLFLFHLPSFISPLSSPFYHLSSSILNPDVQLCRQRLPHISVTATRTRPHSGGKALRIMNIFTAGVEKVTRGGDTIFLVGASKKGVQVDSFILKKASPVFATSLAEYSRIQVCDGNNFIIELPDDAAEDFITIAKLIHGCRDMPTVDAVFGCLDLANKYKFSLPLSAAFDTWIKDLACRKDTPSLWKLLVCAYKLDYHQAFTQASRKLLLIHTSSFWELAELTPTFDLSFKLACKTIISFVSITMPHTDSRSQIILKVSNRRSWSASPRSWTVMLHMNEYPKCGKNRDTLNEFTQIFQDIMLTEDVNFSYFNPLEKIFRGFKNCREGEKNSDSAIGGLAGEQWCSCYEHLTVDDFCGLARERAEYCELQLVGISLQRFKEGKFQDFEG